MPNRILWTIEVPKSLDKALEDFIKDPKCQYKTKSEFIRDVVRKRLEKERVSIKL